MIAKLVQYADRPDHDRSDADSDEERRVRAGNDPAQSSADQSKRNDVRQYRVVHSVGSFPAQTLLILLTSPSVALRQIKARSCQHLKILLQPTIIHQ
jgi:hypothetical protein